MEKAAQIITVANQKGGVGKTTTVMNLGAALARQGKRVLLVDSDPQGNLTSYCGVRTGENPVRTLDEIYLAKRPLNSALVAEFATPVASEPGLDLIAADGSLSGVEYFLFSRSDRETVLAGFLRAARTIYDFILIDTPPSVGLLTLNALAASDFVLIPVQAEYFGLEGIVKIRQAIAQVKERWNASLEIIGVLPTMVSGRRKLTGEVLAVLERELGSLVTEARIHYGAPLAESAGHARSVFDHDSRARGSADYAQLASELINKTVMKLEKHI